MADKQNVTGTTPDNDRYDFLGIGDIVCDAFIKLREAWIENDSPEKAPKELCMSFGDKLPYEEVVEVWGAGNSSNAALSATRLGHKAAVLSDVGGDRIGEEIIKGLSDKGLDTSHIRVHAKAQSNYHYVLRYETERTILIKHHDYPYLWPAFPEDKHPRWFYLSSVGENSLSYHEAIFDYLRNVDDTKMAFQPGTFQMRLPMEIIKPAYELAEAFFCNVEEAQMILEKNGLKTSLSGEAIRQPENMKALLNHYHELGPRFVCITDGPDGAYASDKESGEKYFMPIYPDPAPPQERTGCGDAFASCFTSFLAHDMSFVEALRRAPIQPMSVVQHVGAHTGLLTLDQLNEYLENAPSDFEPRNL